MDLLLIGRLVVGGAAVAGAGIGVVLGWKNLAQAKVLQHDVPPSRLEQNVGRAVTVVGTPTSLYAGNDPFLARALWHRKEYQELRTSYGRDHSHTHWSTVRTDVADWGLALDVGGVRVEVRNEPTEVYGTTSETIGGDWGDQYRTKTEYLPLVPRLTVCGLLDRSSQGLCLLPHPKHGLLYAPDPPHARARTEMIKGWAGLVGAPLAAAAAAGVIIHQWL